MFQWTDGRGDFTPSQNRHINDCQEFHTWLAAQDELEKLYLTPDLTEGQRSAELLSFLGYDHCVAGIPVHPLTLAGMALASACGCAYIDGGEIKDSDSDILAYILVSGVKESRIKPGDIKAAKDYRCLFGGNHVSEFISYLSANLLPLECLPSDGQNARKQAKLDAIWLTAILRRVNAVTGLKPHEILELPIVCVHHLVVEWKRMVDRQDYPRPSKAGMAIDKIREKMWEIIDRDGIE